MAVSMTRKKALHVCSGHSNIKNSSKKTNCTEAAGSFPVAEMERSLALAARNKVELDRAMGLLGVADVDDLKKRGPGLIKRRHASIRDYPDRYAYERGYGGGII